MSSMIFAVSPSRLPLHILPPHRRAPRRRQAPPTAWPEDPTAARRRFDHAFDRIPAHLAGNVLVVAHGDTVAQFVAHSRGIPDDSVYDGVRPCPPDASRELSRTCSRTREARPLRSLWTLQPPLNPPAPISFHGKALTLVLRCAQCRRAPRLARNFCGESVPGAAWGGAPPSSRTNRTRCVPHPIQIGHAASLSQVAPRAADRGYPGA